MDWLTNGLKNMGNNVIGTTGMVVGTILLISALFQGISFLTKSEQEREQMKGKLVKNLLILVIVAVCLFRLKEIISWIAKFFGVDIKF